MTRRTLMALTFCMAGTMLVVAQNPPAGDPDAKGTVSVSVTKIDNGKVDVTITRGVSTGWTLGDVRLYSMSDSAGAVVGGEAIPFMIPEDGSPATTATAQLDLPSGKHLIWALHSIADQASDAQTVGSALAEVTVPGTAGSEGRGWVTVASAGRADAGASFKPTGSYANGTWSIVSGQPNKSVLIPAHGGLVREGTANPKATDSKSGTWATASKVYVPSTLKQNIFAAGQFESGTSGVALGSWLKSQ